MELSSVKMLIARHFSYKIFYGNVSYYDLWPMKVVSREFCKISLTTLLYRLGNLISSYSETSDSFTLHKSYKRGYLTLLPLQQTLQSLQVQYSGEQLPWLPRAFKVEIRNDSSKLSNFAIDNSQTTQRFMDLLIIASIERNSMVGRREELNKQRSMILMKYKQN